MSSGAQIEGTEEFNRKMLRLAKNLGDDQVAPVTHEAAKMVTAQVQANVNAINKVTGNLRASPVTRQMSRTTSIAAIDRRIAPHAHLVEKGAKGGTIPAQPFFRPAWDATKGAAKAHIANGIKKLVEGAVK